MAFYNLSSFFSASSWNSFATAHFNAQSTSIGVMFNLSYLSYLVSECWRVWWVAQGALCRMSLCQDTSVGCCIIHYIIIIPFSLTGIIYIFPFPSRQSSGLLPPSREVWSGRQYLQSTSCQRILYQPLSPNPHSQGKGKIYHLLFQKVVKFALEQSGPRKQKWSKRPHMGESLKEAWLKRS